MNSIKKTSLQRSGTLRLAFFQNPTSWLALLLLIGSLALLTWTNANYIVPLKDLTVPNSANDFGVFWSGTKVIVAGQNPYIYKPDGPFIEVVLAAGGQRDAIEPFISPYYMSLLFLPFTLLGLGAAASLWLTLLQVLLVTGVMLIVKATTGRVTPGTILLGIGLAMLWRYTFLVMMIGNISLVLFFFITVSYYCSRTGRPELAGALAAGLLIKPHTVFLTLPLLLLVPTHGEDGPDWWNDQTRRRWLGFGLTAVGLAVYSFGKEPGWVGDWLKLSNGYSAKPNIDLEMSSLRSLLALFITDRSLIIPGLIAIGLPLWLGIGWLWWRHRADIAGFPYLLSLAIVVCLLTSPYIRDYDSGMLLFALLWSYFTLYNREKNRRQRVGWSWLVWPVALLPFAVHLTASDEAKYAAEAIVPSVVAVLVWWVWRQTTTRTGREAVSQERSSLTARLGSEAGGPS